LLIGRYGIVPLAIEFVARDVNRPHLEIVTFTPFGYLLASISQQTFGPVSVVVAPIS
jgi:hypothetical protein